MGVFDVKFQFTRKGQTSATPLATIDEELCEILNEEVHPRNYVWDWYDQFGSIVYNDDKNPYERWVAKAKQTRREVTETYAKWHADRLEATLKIIKHLETNYDVRIWY